MPALLQRRFRRKMTFLAMARRRLQKFGPYQSLAILLVPLLIVEPLKVAGLAFTGLGHWFTGACMIIGGYAAGALLIDRLFRVGKSKLYTLPWCFALATWAQAKLATWKRKLRRNPVEPVIAPKIDEIRANLTH